MIAPHFGTFPHLAQLPTYTFWGCDPALHNKGDAIEHMNQPLAPFMCWKLDMANHDDTASHVGLVTAQVVLLVNTKHA